MLKKIAINGFGRIGRNTLRAFFENPKWAKQFQIVAINDIGSLESLAHLLQFDTTHGRFERDVSVAEDKGKKGIFVGDTFIQVCSFDDPKSCPWAALDIDFVLESTGNFRSKAEASKHLDAGAKRVIIGSVAFDKVDSTIVYGVNHESLHSEDRIISAASCTTHCIAPILNLLLTHGEIESVLMTEVHAYTSDQQILDRTHRDLRRARAGALNIIPTTSSSIGAVQNILPSLKGKIEGHSLRVPVNNVAAVDLTVTFSEMQNYDDLIKAIERGADEELLSVSDLPLVSSDFNHSTQSAIIDLNQIKVLGKSVKVFAWYDNEWAYANRLLDLIAFA